jgi:hypothetical protein
MMTVIKFRVEDGLKHLMADPEFKRRIVRAYENQVERNHVWGFTVKYKGYRIRFDIDDKASSRIIIGVKKYLNISMAII